MDPIDQHIDFCRKTIKALDLIISHESKAHSFFCKDVSPLPYAPEEVNTAKGMTRKPRVLFKLGYDKNLKGASELGCRFAYFVPSRSKFRFDPNKGMPSEIPSDWVELGRNVETGDQNEYIFNAPEVLGDAANVRGELLFRPNTGTEVVRDVYQRMLDYPEKYFLACPSMSVHYHEDGINLPQGAVVDGLTPEQAHCVAFANLNPVTFIWGPPGTGKSATLCGAVSHFLSQGKRILVMATANDAIDSIAEKLYGFYLKRKCPHVVKAVEERLITRYGTSERSRKFKEITYKAKQKYYKAQGKIPPKIEACMDIDLVSFSTLYRFMHQKQMIYDVVIVDEAGAVNIPTLYAAAACAKEKFIICGDPRQTEPIFNYSPRDVGAETYEIFSKDIYKHNKLRINPGEAPDARICALTTQFRMDDKIAEAVRLTNLYPRYETYPKLILPRGAKSALACHPLSGHPIVLVDTGDINPIYSDGRNQKHADLAKMLALSASSKSDVSHTGIVTPYRHQADLYREWLKKEGVLRILVGTVHNFQGSESLYVVFDTVESPAAAGTKAPSLFFSDDVKYSARSTINVLNVAVSRAQAKLVVLANVGFLLNNLTRDCYLRRLIDHIRNVGSVVNADSLLTNLNWRLGAETSKSKHFNKEPQVFMAENIWNVFKADMSVASEKIEILSPEFNKEFFYKIINILTPQCQKKGIAVYFYTKLRIPKDDKKWMDHHVESSPFLNIRSASEWTAKYHHAAFIAIDERVTYDGISDDPGNFLQGEVPKKILRVVFDRPNS